MWSLFSNDDLRRLSAGVAIASVAGLLMGAAMRPDLDEHDAAGPQMLMGEAGARKVFTAYDPGVGAYQGQLPDYVVGTDWARQQAVPQPREVPLEDETVVYEDPSPVEVAHTTYVDEPRPEPRYPSMRGNGEYEANLPPPPAPPDDVDGEPVVITG